jgi:hypothetical protein
MIPGIILLSGANDFLQKLLSSTDESIKLLSSTSLDESIKFLAQKQCSHWKNWVRGWRDGCYFKTK